MRWPPPAKVFAKFVVLSLACSAAMAMLVRIECPPRLYDIRVTNRSGREVASVTLVVSERHGARDTLLIRTLEPDSSWTLVTKLADDVTYDATIRWSDGRIERDTVRDYVDSSTPETSARIDSSGFSLDAHSSERF